MPILLLLAIFLIILFFFVKVGDPTQKNISNNDHFDMKSAYQITASHVRINTILSENTAFTSVKIKDLPWSFNQHAYWLQIVINNRSDQAADLVGHFDNPMLDELSIFQVENKNTIIKQQHQGDQKQKVDFKQRIVPHFNFKMEAYQQTTLYVRILTSGIANTPITIYLQNDYLNLVEKKHLLWGIVTGVLIVIGLYNLLLYFAIKDAVYLIYNGYILSIVCLLGTVLGFGFYLFPEPIQMTFNLQVVALNCLVAIFVILFLVYFLTFEAEKKWPYWFAMFTIYLLSLLLLASLFLPENRSAPLFFMTIPLVYVVCLILLIIRIRSGVQWGRFYIYSWGPLLIGAAIQPLVLMGFVDYSFFSHHAFTIAVLLEIVLMAMALADRMRFQETQVIFHATHELNSGLPNVTLLERHISSLLETKESFATCLVNIVNYQILSSYIPTKELYKLEKQVISNISPLLNDESYVSIISDIDGKKCYLAKVTDGRLMFIFKSATRFKIDRFLNTLQLRIQKELQLNGLLIEIKTQIGICLRRDQAHTYNANEFIQHALAAIEKNNELEASVHYYHDLQPINMKEHLTLACDLQRAMRENQLQLYHQPQILLKDYSIYGSEVLLRWQHPEHGAIPPQLFVSMAEDMGLINELTRWVIREAFEQLPDLLASQHLPYRVSINISGKDIGLSYFLEFVKEMMINFKVPRDVIIFELTESVMVTDFKMLESLIVALSDLGIKVSIDDYGTGYSSLNYISQLQFDELKIDKIFVLDLDSSQRNLTIVKTTIEMAKNLKLKVVAEGVESKLIEDKLIESGCDISQGYYYTQPLPFDQYLLWLKHFNGH